MNKGHAIFKRMQRMPHLQEGDTNFDPSKWADPGPLPSPPPDPNVYINQYPPNFQSPPSSLPYDPSYPGPTSPNEFGSGHPTSKGVGTGVGVVSNFVFPGLGLLTGPLASWAVRMMQAGMSRDAVQKAVQDYQQQQQGTGTSSDTGGTADDSTGTTGPAPPTATDPTVGIGIDPTGNPAKPGEFWSNDFGRWDTDKYGTTPGNYVGPGPGLPQGRFGTGFGSGTVGNFATAIGFDSLGRGGGSANLPAIGGGPAASQARQIMKGIYTPMTGYGYGPLSGFTGTQNPGAAANINAQQQLHDILMANPGALSGPISGNITRGVPMKQSVQMGSSDINPGLTLFRKQQLKRKKP